MPNRNRNQNYGHSNYGNRSMNNNSERDWNRNSSDYQNDYSSDYNREDKSSDRNRQNWGQNSMGGNYGQQYSSYNRDYDEEYNGVPYQTNTRYPRNYERGNDYNPGRYGSEYSTGNYGSNYDYSNEGNYMDSERGYDHRNRDRDWWDKTSDEISSWFGDEEAEQRRRMDARQGQHRGRGPRNYKRSDDRIKEDVNDRLTDYSYLDASDIEVEVSNGEVTLTGTVDSRYSKRIAEDLAEDVSGVTNVENRLRVSQSSYTSSNTQNTGTTSTETSNQTSGLTDLTSKSKTV
ncbi:MAG: BON domain-containing protein [Pyrinomonadaceae bacterium]|nr:BON domain-containing protein [Pyrinomonadaceae bacterium]